MSTYQLVQRDTMHVAGWRNWLLRDGELEDEELLSELTAHVRSGEYFAMLATNIDAISDRLVAANEAEQEQLQRIADDLLELQLKYKITKK